MCQRCQAALQLSHAESSARPGRLLPFQVLLKYCPPGHPAARTDAQITCFLEYESCIAVDGDPNCAARAERTYESLHPRRRIMAAATNLAPASFRPPSHVSLEATSAFRHPVRPTSQVFQFYPNCLVARWLTLLLRILRSSLVCVCCNPYGTIKA